MPTGCDPMRDRPHDRRRPRRAHRALEPCSPLPATSFDEAIHRVEGEAKREGSARVDLADGAGLSGRRPDPTRHLRRQRGATAAGRGVRALLIPDSSSSSFLPPACVFASACRRQERGAVLTPVADAAAMRRGFRRSAPRGWPFPPLPRARPRSRSTQANPATRRSRRPGRRRVTRRAVAARHRSAAAGVRPSDT